MTERQSGGCVVQLNLCENRLIWNAKINLLAALRQLVITTDDVIRQPDQGFFGRTLGK